jgi:hypothetical protein
MDEVKLLSRPTNYAVVHLPGRAFPGIVFQGHSLNILIKDLERVAMETDAAEREATLADVIQRLREAQVHYETVLKREGISLPYVRP